MSVFSTKHPKRQYPDLTKEEGSVGQKFERLVKTIDTYKTLEDLKKEVHRILDEDDTRISKHKKREYENLMAKIYSLPRLRKLVADIYLASANLGVDKLDKQIKILL